MSGTEGTTFYAFGLGLVGGLNPCGFPLLPAYMSLFVGDTEATVTRRIPQALAGAGFATVGFVAIFGLVGLLAEAGVGLVTVWIPWVMIPLALSLVGIGLAGVAGRLRGPALHVATGTWRHRPAALAGFGASYGMASLSCALPVFLAGVAGSFARSGFTAGLGDFVAYALGMGLLLAVAALAVATGGAGALRRFRSASALVPRLGGAVLVLVGAYLVYYWSYALVDPLAAPWLVGEVDHVRASLAGWLSGATRWAGVALGSVVLAAMAASAAAERRPMRATPPSAPQGKPGP